MGFNTFPCNPYPISTDELNKGNNDDLNTRVAALESDVSDLNSNKANQITIAPFFNAETAYTAGDLVYYNGLSYRCTNDHEGAWDADDFAATTIANELDALKSGLIRLDNLEFISFDATSLDAIDLCAALSTAIGGYSGSFIGYAGYQGKHLIAGYSYYSNDDLYFTAILVNIGDGQLYTYTGLNGVYSRKAATMTS